MKVKAGIDRIAGSTGISNAAVAGILPVRRKNNTGREGLFCALRAVLMIAVEREGVNQGKVAGNKDGETGDPAINTIRSASFGSS